MILRLVALLIGLLAAGSAPAETRGFGSLSSGDEDFLPVEQAFIASAELKGSAIHAHWDIADGYYLYRHALRFTLADAGNVKLGQPRIPAGTQKEDEYFGTVEIYHKTLDVTIPYSGSFEPGTVPMVQLRYQGCAERGL